MAADGDAIGARFLLTPERGRAAVYALPCAQLAHLLEPASAMLGRAFDTSDECLVQRIEPQL
jgi:hypothetical protein